VSHISYQVYVILRNWAIDFSGLSCFSIKAKTTNFLAFILNGNAVIAVLSLLSYKFICVYLCTLREAATASTSVVHYVFVYLTLIEKRYITGINNDD
jgi:hypothetical protein